ncbi:hypothetical protein F751_3085 [Auxenochlorella protothecoides]|uniref:Uncharacterized protein n=1 Tax=Auxenochlorella protothecoides TaxID=3075 RepID=A0A087SF63_AUXPR|nr:hypothetical protein F751_3085 [Auxenochlorella protothecoides]KFM24367.1 hypothetical protein F751_3085 [Auxenochlorella protothecoides]
MHHNNNCERLVRRSSDLAPELGGSPAPANGDVNRISAGESGKDQHCVNHVRKSNVVLVLRGRLFLQENRHSRPAQW